MARVGSQRYNGVLGNVILIFISSYNNPYRFIFNYDLWPVKIWHTENIAEKYVIYSRDMYQIAS